MSQIHQDATSVKPTGAYTRQRRSAVQLVRGYSKDHRPDLRQPVYELVYELSVTRDGAIPVLFKTHDGQRSLLSPDHAGKTQVVKNYFRESHVQYGASGKVSSI